MLLGIDLGTSSVKALVMQEDGQVLAESSTSYPVNAPRGGWAETEPNDWWQATVKAVTAATHQYKHEITAIGLSGQMHGVVLCDEQGKSVRPAILWADTRSEATLNQYKNLNQPFKELLANPLAAGMAGPSLLWLKEHEPSIYESARWALQPKDWLRYTLTGEVQTEPSDASATLLFDVKEGCWSDSCLQQLGLREDCLAPIVKSSSLVGSLQDKAANQLGLSKDTIVVAGAADAAASALGGGLIHEGQVQINIGTAMQIFCIRDEAVVDPTLRTHLYCNATDSFYAMAAMKNAGIALEWVRRILGMSWEEMYHEAFTQVDSSEGLIFLPYLTGERTPHLNNEIRGLWSGMGLQHERGHLARAAFEGVAFALKDGWLALQEAGVQAKTLRLSGGANARAEWQQLLADTLRLPLSIVSIPNSSARGAALLAGLGTRVYRNPEETLEHLPKIAVTVEPAQNPSLMERYQAFRTLYKKIV